MCVCGGGGTLRFSYLRRLVPFFLQEKMKIFFFFFFFFFGGGGGCHCKIGPYFLVISMFLVYFLKVKVQNRNIFWGR